MKETAQTSLRKSISFIEAMLGMMACISLILIFGPKDWATKALTLDIKDYKAYLTDDKYSGGNSTATWIDANARYWRCELGSQYPNPYCSLVTITLGDTWSGLDLRDYTSMTVYGSYKGDGRYIRIYLRNRHPRYYVSGDDTTTKYNVVEFPANDLENGFTFNMHDFKVADWWTASKNIPLEDSHPQFNDVVFVEIQTGSQVRSGVHEFQIDKIVWKGNLISDETLYKIIVIAWSVFIFAILLFRVVKLKLELSRNQRYQQELVSINKLLNLQNKQFEDLAKSDQLTGLFNRIGIRDVLYEGLQDWKEKREPFSFVMIDIDHFKKINDTHGHDVGDKILRATAELLRKNVRRTDYLARWGGEEFILVCPDTDLKQAQVVAEMLRMKLEESPVYNDIMVTASFGVASMSSPDLDHLFKSADEALYEAKAQGRNRVAFKY